MKLFKKFVPVMLSAVLVLSSATSAMACTGVYVGSDVSENGSTYMGRSEDIGDLYGKVYGVAEPRTIAEGEVYKDTYGFEMDYDAVDFDYPSTTYKYTYVRDSYNYGETMQDEDGNYVGEAYAEAGQNEKGVSMSATVSTSYNQDAKAADPLVGTGICEVSMTSIVLGGAATAREGIELMAAIIDEYGAGECNSIMISDANETWYMEIVSGHQYAAIKMPADKVSVQPNIMLLGVIDVTDTENVIVSENLVKLAEENGFLETDANGNINVAKTYARETAGKGQYSRYWQGLYYVNQSAAELIKNTILSTNMGTDPLPLLIDPTDKLSTLEVLQLLATRGEGTEMDSNATDDEYYAIGNNRQAECHIFETRANMPIQLATIQWQSMADAEFSIYLPYYSALITEVDESYDNEAVKSRSENITDEAFVEKTKDSLNWNFQQINHLCYNNRDLCADNVKAYFEAWQNSLIEQQEEIDALMLAIYAYDKELAAEKATALGEDLAEQTLAMTNVVLAELKAHIESGSTEEFVPSVMTEDLMPVYSFDNVGGTGLPADEDLSGGQNGDSNLEDEDNKQEVGTKVPQTGDNADLMVYVMLTVAAASAVILLKKKLQK